MEGKPAKRHNTRAKSAHSFERVAFKAYWRPLSLQAIASPDRFVKIVNSILSGERTLFSDFNS